MRPATAERDAARSTFMTEDAKKRQEKLRGIVGGLKEEIFVELDKRIKETEESLSTQITEQFEQAGGQLEEQVGEKVEGEVKRQIRAWKNLNKRVKEDLYNFQENLQAYHKIPYAIMVVMGFLLFWYGAWSVIRVLPILNNGFVALVAGGFLLFVTGSIYKKLIG